MAKQYAIRNITTSPAFPIHIVTGPCGGAVGDAYVTVNTDGVPVHLNEEQYSYAKDAIALREKENQIVCQVIGEEPEAPAEPTGMNTDEAAAKAAAEEEAELRKRAKEIGYLGWHNAGIDKLKAAIAEHEAE